MLEWSEPPAAAAARHGAIRVRPGAAHHRPCCRSRFAASGSSGRCRRGAGDAPESAALAALDARARRLRGDRDAPASGSTSGSADRPPTCACSCQRRRTASIRTPACPGSARRSAATASSPRCRRSGSTRGSRAACSTTWPRRRPIDVDPAQDAEPGKILHETRSSEMARLGEVPFGRYYGSVDATPLFVMLAGAYFERTGDRAFLTRLWPHVERALDWIDDYGDRDGDGFVEYARRSPTGLVQQGWKDSQDSVFHADGSLAEPPIALCEVQAYVYDARGCGRARMADALGEHARADRAAAPGGAAAARLRRAVLVRGGVAPTRSRSTARSGRAACAARTPATACSAASPRRIARGASPSSWSAPRCSPAGASGRIASIEPRYNPMSYHNGSVWPHDNGLIAAGLLALPIRRSDWRAPFDGAVRRQRHDGRPPAAGAVLRIPPPHRRRADAVPGGVLAAGVGVRRRVSSDSGVPAAVGRRRSHAACRSIARSCRRFSPTCGCSNLELPFGQVDLLFEQHPLDVSVTVLRKHGDFEVRVIK